MFCFVREGIEKFWLVISFYWASDQKSANSFVVFEWN